MTTDTIEITYVEFSHARMNRGCRIDYIEWKRGEIEQYWPGEVNDSIIPDDVRVALALLVAPGLVEEIKR